ncbi:MAG: methyltransferase, partial [Ignavibacteriae bacterium]|nr:methyltransferase [Ignavibacteriota bacterium]
FTAGFSYKFVEEIIKLEGLKDVDNAEIFDPFAGCGTTLVSSQKEGVKAVGNESQAFMFDIIKAKLNWSIKRDRVNKYLSIIKNFVDENLFDVESSANPLLISLYDSEDLEQLYLIRNSAEVIKSEKYRLFFKLALSQSLHEVANHPIAVPYISRKKLLSNEKSVWDVFSSICKKMVEDTESLDDLIYSKIYKQDSRKVNRFIEDDRCITCITSPPYLNNLDYGEVSKVHTHFFDITSSWNDITNKIRKKLVTGATTHYNKSDFNKEKFLESDFAKDNMEIVLGLMETSRNIKNKAIDKGGKKSFDLLLLFYFRDMYLVLKEIKRVLMQTGKAYLILGDSAPYGVYVPTTKILGEIAMNIGFESYEIHKIRTRGTKWKTLKHRHSIELNENVLILK